jgi:hypothetical protein
VASSTLDQTLRQLRSKAAADADLAEALAFLAADDTADDPSGSVAPEVTRRVRSINRRRLEQRRHELRDRSLTTAGVVDYIDSISDRRAVDRRRKRGTLLGIPAGAEILHPLWQFDPDRADTRAGLDRVIAALREITTDGLAADALMVTPRPDLGDRTLADVFADGDVDLAARLIRMAGDQS